MLRFIKDKIKEWFTMEDLHLEEDSISVKDALMFIKGMTELRVYSNIDKIRHDHTIDKISMHKGKIGGFKWIGTTTKNAKQY